LNSESRYQANLHGIDPNATYQVRFAETYDTGSQRTMSGRELQHLTVNIEKARGSLLIRYLKETNAR
jgi:hypothetical protein